MRLRRTVRGKRLQVGMLLLLLRNPCGLPVLFTAWPPRSAVSSVRGRNVLNRRMNPVEARLQAPAQHAPLRLPQTLRSMHSTAPLPSRRRTATLVPGVWRLVRILCPCHRRKRLPWLRRLVRILCPCDPRKRVMTPQSLMRDPSLCDRCKRGTELRRLMRILRLCHRRKRLPGLWRLMRIPRLCYRRKRVMGPSLLMRTPRLCDLPTRPLQRRRATHPLPSCLNPHACRSQRLTW